MIICNKREQWSLLFNEWEEDVDYGRADLEQFQNDLPNDEMYHGSSPVINITVISPVMLLQNPVCLTSQLTHVSTLTWLRDFQNLYR